MWLRRMCCERRPSEPVHIIRAAPKKKGDEGTKLDLPEGT